MKLLSLTIESPVQGEGAIKINPPGGLPSGGFGDNTANNLIGWGLTALLVGGTLLALAYLIWGGVQWITSGGDKSKIQAARNKMTYAIIGLVIAFLSFFIVTLIGGFFQVNLLWIK